MSAPSVYDHAFVLQPAPGVHIAGLPLPEAEFVQLLLAFRTGTVEERVGEEGFAELLATLMTRGAGDWDRYEFARQCDLRGVSLQVSAGRDLLLLELAVLPEDLDWGLQMLAQVIGSPRLTAEEIAVAAAEQRQQNQARADEQRTALGDVARGTLFDPRHAYSRPVGGRSGTPGEADAESVRAFHQRLLLGSIPWALCVAGAFAPERIEESVRSTLGGLFSGRVPQGPESSPGRSVLALDPEPFQYLPFPTEQCRVLIGLPGVARGDERYLETSLVNELFGGAFLSRLTRAVRSKEGLAYSASSSLWAGFQGGCLWVSLQTDQRHVPKALRTVRVAVEELAQGSLPEEELEQFRQFAEISLTFEYDSLSGLTSRLLDHVLLGEPWQPERRRLALRRHSRREDLEAVISSLLRPEAAVVCVSGGRLVRGAEAAFFRRPTAAQRRTLAVPPLGPMEGPVLPGATQDLSPQVLAQHAKGCLVGFPNGVRLLCLPRPELLSISLQVWTCTGSMDEPPGQSGMSHLLEHLMFRGTPNFPDGQFDALLARKGGLNNAFTSEDFTVYTDYVVLEGLPEALCLESDRFRHLQIAEDLFQTEREVVLEERSLRVESSPLGQLYEWLQKAAYPDHPYGWPVIGWREDLVALQAEDLRRHFQQAVRPERLLLVIAGGCKPAMAIDWVARTFAASPLAEPAPQPVWPLLANAEPVPRLASQTLTHQDRSGYSYLLVAFRCPREGHPDYEAVELLSRLLGQGDSSRLHDHFVRQRRVALEVWVSYQAQCREHPLMHLGLASAEDFDLTTRREELSEFLRQLPESLQEEDLSKARRGWLAEEAFSSDELEDWAVEIAGRVLLRPWDEVWTTRERLEAVTLEDLRRVCRHYLDPEYGLFAYLKGLTTSRPSLEADEELSHDQS